MVSNKRHLSGRRSIIIVGFMAAGKTTIGGRLAARLGIPFFDTDREIEKIFGSSVTEIFARHGESKFRAAEKEVISRLLGEGQRVLSVGGGAYADQQLRRTINSHGTSVWLDPPFDLIVDRLVRSTDRPLASGKSPDALRRLWRERRQSYAEAHLRIEISDPDPDKVVERILRLLPLQQARCG